MTRFPMDATRERVIKAFEQLGFHFVREGNHIAMVRENPDGTRPPPDYAQPSQDQGLNITNDSDPGADTQGGIYGSL